MPAYHISSECGDRTITAETLDTAKDIYEREMHYHFDEAATIPGSWYTITDEDGEVIEEDACPA